MEECKNGQLDGQTDGRTQKRVDPISTQPRVLPMVAGG